MTALDGNPHTLTPPGIEPGGERIVREIDGVGTLTFDDFVAGQWLTKKGEPAKISKRRYALDDRELDSVSSVVDTLRAWALEDWIERQATIGAARAMQLGKLRGVPEEEWRDQVKALGLGASAKRDEGADRGKAIHAVFEALALGRPAPNPAEFPALARPWLRGALLAWLALGVTESVAVEEIVCNPEHGYAGRPDLVCVADGRLTLVDWKTGKGRVYDKAHYQTRLYAMALAASVGIVVDRIVIVGIADDGGFELIECAVSEVDVVALLTVFRSRRRVESDMRAQRSIARAAAR